MSRAPAIRIAYLLASWLAASAPGRAQNPEAKTGTPAIQTDVRQAGTEDSIATAKREFDAVKSLRDFGPQAKGGLPRMSVPEMQTGASAALPSQKLKTPEGEKRPANWLVDAMAKQSAARSGPGRESETRTLEQAQERTERREEDLKGGGPANERKERHASNNPFARFLGDWISPQDYALLKPGLEQSFSSDASGPNGPKVAALGESFALKPTTGLESIDGFEPKSQPFGENTPARENPYLQALANPVTAAAVSSLARPVPAMTPPPATSKIGLPAEFQTGVTPPKKHVPDFVRPTTDEKYFKQLKRF